VQLGAAVSDPEVVALFLRGEWDSGRNGSAQREWLAHLRLDPALVLEPDLDSAVENQQRATLLGRLRGWRTEMLFAGFPADARWYEVRLTPQEFAELRYIRDGDAGGWTLASNGTRRVADAVSTLREGPSSDPTVADIERRAVDLAARVDGGQVCPPIIVCGESADGPLVILEGHLRATAYGLATAQPAERPAILALSPDMAGWAWF
jgi:hypothetical protein